MAVTTVDGFNADPGDVRECALCDERVAEWTPALGRRPFETRGEDNKIWPPWVGIDDKVWPAWCRPCQERITKAQDAITDAKCVVLGRSTRINGTTEIQAAEMLRAP